MYARLADLFSERLDDDFESIVVVVSDIVTAFAFGVRAVEDSFVGYFLTSRPIASFRMAPV